MCSVYFLGINSKFLLKESYKKITKLKIPNASVLPGVVPAARQHWGVCDNVMKSNHTCILH